MTSFNSPEDQWALFAGSGYYLLSAPAGVLRIGGSARLDWLTTLSTQVFSGIDSGITREGLILDPQGHIKFPFMLTDDGSTAWLVAPDAPGLADFLRSMVFMYDVTIEELPETRVAWFLGGGVLEQAAVGDSGLLLLRDPWPNLENGGTCYFQGEHPAQRLPVIGVVTDTEGLARLKERAAQALPTETVEGYPVSEVREVSPSAWDALQIQRLRPGAAELDERSLPHELDWLRTAVHLNKGCYCGQETVARIVNMGAPPRRLVRLDLDGAHFGLPEPGAEVFAAHAGGESTVNAGEMQVAKPQAVRFDNVLQAPKGKNLFGEASCGAAQPAEPEVVEAETTAEEPIKQQVVGRVTRSANHYIYGPIAFALLRRSATGPYVVAVENGTVDAVETEIVPRDGRSADSPESRPGIGLPRLGAGIRPS